MARGASNIDYSGYDAEALKATFLETMETVAYIRGELLARGFWIDSKYNVTPIAELEDSHIVSIIRMMKNKCIKRSRYWKGLHDKTWQEFILEEHAYPHLYREANERNLPGAGTLPNPEAE